MYIAQVFKYKYDFWRYIIGIVAVVIGVTVAQFPFVFAIISEFGMKAMYTMTETEMMSALESNETLFYMLLPFAAGLVVVILIARHLHNQPLTPLTTARKKIDWKRFWFGFLLVVAFITIITLGDYFSNPEDYQYNFKPQPFLILLVIATLLIPLQTSFEEYLFRGYLMQGLGALAKNKWIPLFITSLIFGGLHYANPEVDKLGNLIMIHYIGTGFFLGIITLMDEGMELALGFHAGNNLLTALLVTADWTAFQTHSIFKDLSDPSVGWDVIIPVLVVYPVFLFIMAKKYNWTDWKGKLFGRVERPVVITETSEAPSKYPE